jgi:tRNA A37 threonylcarbamoyladenosine biosynthesis protein TsaE
MLATKIEKHINFSKASEEDLLDLLTVCSNALTQMKVNDYHEYDFLHAVEWSDLMQDCFETIKETQEFLEIGLTRSEWAQLCHWCSQELQFRYTQEDN